MAEIVCKTINISWPTGVVVTLIAKEVLPNPDEPEPAMKS